MESVLAQTYRDFEYIIIDGASTDDSVVVISEYISRFQKKSLDIKYVSEPDSGIYNAMNKGTLMAEDEYCFYLNSGDSLFESTTLLQVFGDNNSVDFIFGRVGIYNDNGCLQLVGKDNIDFTPFQLFLSSPPHQGSFIKKALIEKIGLYDESYKLVADLKCIYQCIMIEKASVLYKNIVISVMEANGISYQNHEQCLEEDDRMMVELYSEEFKRDFHDWIELRKKNEELQQKFNTYKNAILFYDKIRKHILARQIFNSIVMKFYL